jgi:hypothetical protein
MPTLSAHGPQWLVLTWLACAFRRVSFGATSARL